MGLHYFLFQTLLNVPPFLFLASLALLPQFLSCQLNLSMASVAGLEVNVDALFHRMEVRCAFTNRWTTSLSRLVSLALPLAPSSFSFPKFFFDLLCICYVYVVYMLCICCVYVVYMLCICCVYVVYMLCICCVYVVYMLYVFHLCLTSRLSSSGTKIFIYLYLSLFIIKNYLL
jgi:hypothetical protein